jgi:hypothetical protein
MFCVTIRVNSDVFLKQHLPTDLCNEEVSSFSLREIIKYYLEELRFRHLFSDEHPLAYIFSAFNIITLSYKERKKHKLISHPRVYVP